MLIPRNDDRREMMLFVIYKVRYNVHYLCEVSYEKTKGR